LLSMNREVFIDASFWIALIWRGDENHSNAERLLEAPLQADSTTVTTNWTLYEAMTFLVGRAGRHDLALDLYDTLVKEMRTTIFDAATVEESALEIFRRHSDKEWSVVDCCNFACIRTRGSEYALAFDHNFHQAQTEFGFTVL